MLVSMKTAIIGSGAIGSLFGSLLKANSIDAVLFDKDSGKTDFINKNGIELIYPETGKKLHLYPEASSCIERIRNFDYYILCVKSYSTEEAAEKISRVSGDNSVIVTFQNGMGNVEIIRKYFPDSSVAAGTTSEGAVFTPPASVVYGGSGITAVSIIGRNPDNSKLEGFLKMLNKSGIETVITGNYRHDIWKKLVVNSAINPLTAALRLQNRFVSESPYLRNLAEMIIKESVKAAEADGIILEYEEIRNTVFSVAEKTGLNRSSMLQDIENGRKTEIDFISGSAADKAEKAGISPSVNRIMQNIIKVLEKKHFP